MSGLFWIALGVMGTVALGFVALPLLQTNRKATLLSVAILVPVLTAGLYMELGSPDAGNAGHASIAMRAPASKPLSAASDEGIGSVASMLDGLEARLGENPDDGGSWLLLAKSYKYLNRIDEAIDAYGKAAALGEHDDELAALSGGAIEEASTGAQIFGNVKLSPDALDIVQATDTVFIFAKAVNGPPAPLAILQRPASELPIDFLLNDSQSMIEGMKLSAFNEVVVTARITRGGDATVALRGLEAKSETVIVAENRHLHLTIE
jgi:hypothetical protein